MSTMAKSTPPSMLARASYRWATGTRSVYPASAIGRRLIHVRPTPPATPDEDGFAAASTPPTTTSDAKFEVLGSPYSLLSVSLSPSQNLYTRRGTLVALSGKPESAVSTLSVLPPLTRALLRIPFLYQKISSTTPATALISTKSPISSFTVVHVDGRLDWIIAQRNALLAWTGHALGIRPRINTKLGIAHWGQMQVTGRGLVALVAKGQIYQVHVKPGEEYVAHPSNVVAYSMSSIPPLPYRFKSSLYRFQVPSMSLGTLVPRIKFFQDVSESQAWKAIARTFFQARTLARRTIWGDRLFLRFQGPTTILLQSRAGRLSDSLSSRDIDEIADTPTGAVPEAVKANFKKELGFDYTADVKVPQTPVGQPATIVAKPVQPIRGPSSSPSSQAAPTSP